MRQSKCLMGGYPFIQVCKTRNRTTPVQVTIDPSLTDCENRWAEKWSSRNADLGCNNSGLTPEEESSTTRSLGRKEQYRAPVNFNQPPYHIVSTPFSICKLLLPSKLCPVSSWCFSQSTSTLLLFRVPAARQHHWWRSTRTRFERLPHRSHSQYPRMRHKPAVLL